jgi:hypothetical protein
MNPVNENDWANRPNYATTLEKLEINNFYFLIYKLFFKLIKFHFI